MEQIRFQCRVEKKVKDHIVFKDELPLGEETVFVQCSSCGVMGVMNMADAK